MFSDNENTKDKIHVYQLIMEMSMSIYLTSVDIRRYRDNQAEIDIEAKYTKSRVSNIQEDHFGVSRK